MGGRGQADRGEAGLSPGSRSHRVNFLERRPAIVLGPNSKHPRGAAACQRGSTAGMAAGWVGRACLPLLREAVAIRRMGTLVWLDPDALHAGAVSR